MTTTSRNELETLLKQYQYGIFTACLFDDAIIRTRLTDAEYAEFVRLTGWDVA